LSDDGKFVIQKHDASTLHYDLRLEVNGKGKSWAVPKGPSTDPRVRRLAVQTEDHDLDYFSFEGVIPEGEEGAETVMVWDSGTYRNLNDDKSMDEAIKDGHSKFWLNGEKIKGGYALINTGKRWLLVKMDDDEADARRNPTSTEPLSVKTRRDMNEIAKEEKDK
jgi:DNA ligase D-like protein (predicted 3'-phosphoesterase)